MILTREDLDLLAETSRGKPCSCGYDDSDKDSDHVHLIVQRTPTRYVVKVQDVWRGGTGIWWRTSGGGTGRYRATREEAVRLAERLRDEYEQRGKHASFRP